MPKAAPISYAFVEINKAFEDTVTTDSGIKFFIDSSYEKHNHSVCVGKIHSLPRLNKRNKRILKNLSVGDEVCFSFRVVADLEHVTTEGYFTRVSPKEEKYHIYWINGKTEKLIKMAYRSTTGAILWMGSLLDKMGNPIHGIDKCQREDEVDRWLTQFSFSQEDKYKFKNLIDLGDGNNPVWKVELDYIFAKKDANGDLIPVGDRILMKPIERDVKKLLEITKGIILPETAVTAQHQGCARITHDYEPLGIKEGECVAFPQNFVEEYSFMDKPYWLIRYHRISGIWSDPPKLKIA